MDKYGKCCYCQHKRSNGTVNGLFCEVNMCPIFEGKDACSNFEVRFDLANVNFTLTGEIEHLKESIVSSECTGYAVNALKSKQYLEWLEKLLRVLYKLENDIEED